MVDWVRRWVPPGGLVADPYAGLGTVARAVLSAGGGRRYVGWEIDAERHAAASSLIAQWKPMPERW
jgi:DNA modification methylase